MKFKKWKPYILWAILVEAIGFLAGILTREGTAIFQMYAEKPPLTPPGWVFPVVWGILYGLMGISAAIVWLKPDSDDRTKAMQAFWIQLAMNFLWTLVFFNAQAYSIAAFWILALWAAVAYMIIRFLKVDQLAALLQIPYLIWLTLATYLSFGVWLLNS